MNLFQSSLERDTPWRAVAAAALLLATALPIGILAAAALPPAPARTLASAPAVADDACRLRGR